MAAARNKQQLPVGSSQWIREEVDQISQLCDQELDDFTFSARNEVEWLNEHMVEIFSNTHLYENLTDLLKTPGKLRGKTPRTARKRNPLEARQPLSDIFSADKRFNSPTRDVFRENIPTIQPFDENEPLSNEITQTARKDDKEVIDSGYHGMTEDELESVDLVPEEDPESLQSRNSVEPEPMLIDAVSMSPVKVKRLSAERRATECSFHSAREDAVTHELTEENQISKIVGPSSADLVSPRTLPTAVIDLVDVAHDISASPVTERAAQEDRELVLDEDDHGSDIRSPSAGCSPAKPLVRKSSLTFASLPAREPLATKKSTGNRLSRTSNVDTVKVAALTRNSYLGRFTGGKSLGATRLPEASGEQKEYPMEIDNEDGPGLHREEPGGDVKVAMLHSRSSTQRLHDRINALSKMQPLRNKSIPAAAASNQLLYPQLPNDMSDDSQNGGETMDKAVGAAPIATDEEDDWIQPPTVKHKMLPPVHQSRILHDIKSNHSKRHVNNEEVDLEVRDITAARPRSPILPTSDTSQAPYQTNQGSTTVTQAVEAPTNASVRAETLQDEVLLGPSSMQVADSSTTPAGTPTRPLNDGLGALSASKLKLQSIMRSARGLFTSSAGISAQAKLEALPVKPSKHREATSRNVPDYDKIYPTLPAEPETSQTQGPTRIFETKGSTDEEERGLEQEEADGQRMEDELQHVSKREDLEDQTAEEQPVTSISKGPLAAEILMQKSSQPTRQSPRHLSKQDDSQESIFSAATSRNAGVDDLQKSMPPPLARPRTQLQKPKEVRRPIKPAKEVNSKPKPQPVSIRVGTLSRGLPLSSTATSFSSQDLVPPTQSQQVFSTKKGSTASIQTMSSTASFTGSVSSAASKPKALLAAGRKKEQEAKEAQRKREQKREAERKRAAQQQEVQKREQQRQEEERQRERERLAAEEESRKLVQRQANEKRRLDLLKKEQQQRAANELAHALQNDKMAVATASKRPDLGAGKIALKGSTIQDLPRSLFNIPQPNPAKPAPKRIFDPDHEDESLRTARAPTSQSYQSNDGKRRRTGDKEQLEQPIRPTMAPPIRASMIRNDGHKTSIMGSSYQSAAFASSSINGGASQIRMLNGSQHPQSTYPSHSNRPGHAMDHRMYEKGQIPFQQVANPPPTNLKTPMQSRQMPPPQQKSSPWFPNPDSIYLEEIPTDSEDGGDDSDEEGRKDRRDVEDWVLTPNLNQRLVEQESIDPDRVFGPIAPLNMEEMFKDKSRHHRFRARTSSANWFGQDKLTEEEKIKDLAARQKIRQQGGWSFET